jgi:hypothetical protein
MIGNAIRMVRIATGEEVREYEALPEKAEVAAALGRKGGAPE